MIRQASGSFVGYKANDWYAVDIETAKPLFYEGSGGWVALPGVRNAFEGAQAIKENRTAEVIIHRTHLPLLTSPEALKYLTDVVSTDWASRDAWCKERGFTPRVTQHQAVDFIEPRRGVLLGDDMRTGKGHPAGTRILTPDGWTSIEQLRVGDKVIGSDGKPCEVTGLFDRGVLPVYKVRFSDGATIRTDGEHLWHTWDHNAWHRGGKAQVVQTQALANDLRYSNGNRKWRIPLVKPIQFVERELPIDPYVLGVLLGDGSIAHDSVSFTPGDDLVPEEVRKRLPSNVELRSTTTPGKATTWRIVGRHSRHNPMLDQLRALELQGRKSPEKFVPYAYRVASVAQRLALLQGLMDTDGEWHKGNLAFSSSSPMLVQHVKFLVESLGGLARETIREEPKYTLHGETRIGLPSYRLSIAMPEDFEPFLTRAGYAPRQKFKPARLFESIEPDGHDRVYCISVDASDHLYVTEHCIVTHNTLACLLSHDPGRGPLVVVAPLSTRAVWLGWIKKLWPDLPVGVCLGKKPKREDLEKPIVFCHYDILKHWQSARRLGTIIFDEAHFICNRNSDRARASVLVSSRAEKVICATGTPIWDMPPDLWNIIGMLAPAAWGSYFEFGMRYGDPKHNGYAVEFEGATNVEELRARLAEIKIRRLWREVKQDLPPISRNIVVADLNEPTQRKLDILAAKLKKERTNTAANLALYRSQLAKFKLGPTVKEARKLMEAGEPVVVWTWHREFAEDIYTELEGSFLIHGEINANEREKRMDAWRKQPNAALVATMAVAQVGIDLSHSHLPIFAELDYVPAILAQTEMRTYDPNRPMNVTFIIANHVVEQRIVRALISKLNAADPLGFGAAVEAIDALREAFEGPRDDPDMDRFLEDILATEVA